MREGQRQGEWERSRAVLLWRVVVLCGVMWTRGVPWCPSVPSGFQWYPLVFGGVPLCLCEIVEEIDSDIDGEVDSVTICEIDNDIDWLR